ncbi:MAG: hypothetical protein ACYS8L_04210 [Planctomycetota bacterium]
MRVLCLVCVAMLLSGCAGARCHISADTIGYPVSLSSAVFDRAGNVVVIGSGDSREVGHFAFTFRSWSTLFTLVPLSNRNVDLSDRLRQEVEARSGDAIVNLTVRATNNAWWMITALIPIAPAYVTIEVEGNVVSIHGT